MSCKYGPVDYYLLDGKHEFQCDRRRISLPGYDYCEFHEERVFQPNFRDINFKDYRRKAGEEVYKRIETLPPDEPLLLIGYNLPSMLLTNKTFDKPIVLQNAIFHGPIDFSLSTFKKEAIFLGTRFTKDATFFNTTFTKEVTFEEAKFENTANFEKSQFQETVDFSKAQFRGEAVFKETTFDKDVIFLFSKMLGEARFDTPTIKNTSNVFFWNVLIKDPENIRFQTDILSNISFIGTDISRVRFSENVTWGKNKNEKFKIWEERQIEDQLPYTEIGVIIGRKKNNIRLGSMLSVYRNLRENYEFRMRYDEAGEFFIREMEMKRKYEELSLDSLKNLFRLKWKIKEIRKREEEEVVSIGSTNWIVRNFSFLGWYYHLSKYGQSILRPTLFGIGIVALSTFLWFTQPNLSLDFSISEIIHSQKDNFTIPHLEDSLKRSIQNFVPYLPAEPAIQPGIMDYTFKIIGGAVTFGLIIIALRRKFERKFRH